MKTPKEIKKGLMNCSISKIQDIYGNDYTRFKCERCTYKQYGADCTVNIAHDAIVYIQQLERERDELVRENNKLKRKRMQCKKLRRFISFVLPTNRRFDDENA